MPGDDPYNPYQPPFGKPKSAAGMYWDPVQVVPPPPMAGTAPPSPAAVGGGSTGWDDAPEMPVAISGQGYTWDPVQVNPNAPPSAIDVYAGMGAPPDPNAYAYQTPDYSQADAFYGQQQASLDADYQAALAAIERQQGIATQNLAAYPGQLNTIYDQGEHAMDAYAQNQYAAQQQSGLTPLGPAGAGLEPFQTAFEYGRSADLANLPYLEQGTQELFERSRGQARQTKSDMQRDLDARRQEQAIREAEMRAEIANKQADRGYTSAFDLYKDERDYRQDKGLIDYKTDAELRADAAGGKESEYDKTYDRERAKHDAKLDSEHYGPRVVSDLRGEQIYANPEESAQVRTFKSYAAIKKDLASGKSVDDVVEKWGKTQSRSLSLALFEAGIEYPPE